MATTSKKEKQIFIGIDDKVIELTGADLEAFEADRATIRAEQEAFKAEAKAQKELKISAYKKLGLTDEEIAAII